MTVEEGIIWMDVISRRYHSENRFIASLSQTVKSGSRLTERQIDAAKNHLVRSSLFQQFREYPSVLQALTERRTQMGIRILPTAYTADIYPLDVVGLSFPYREELVNELRILQRDSLGRAVKAVKDGEWQWKVKLHWEILPTLRDIFTRYSFTASDALQRRMEEITRDTIVEVNDTITVTTGEANVREWLSYLEYWK